jgi:hypothetical protein
LAIMSGFERRGGRNVPRRLTSVAFFGGGVIGLRYADFTSVDVESTRTRSAVGRRFWCRRN